MFGGGVRFWKSIDHPRDAKGQFRDVPDWHVAPGSVSRNQRETANRINAFAQASPWGLDITPENFDIGSSVGGQTAWIASIDHAPHLAGLNMTYHPEGLGGRSAPVFFNEGNTHITPEWLAMDADERQRSWWEEVGRNSLYLRPDDFEDDLSEMAALLSVMDSGPASDVISLAYAAMAMGETAEIDEQWPGLLPVIRREAVLAGLPVDDGPIALPRPDDDRVRMGVEFVVKDKPDREDFEDWSAQSKAIAKWEQGVLAAVSEGFISPADADALGARDPGLGGSDRWAPLPSTLWHVGTATSDIIGDGFKSRNDLDMVAGRGLAGGSPYTTSFTDDEVTARDIYSSMLEARAFAAGEVTLGDLLDADAAGKWGEPYAVVREYAVVNFANSGGFSNVEKRRMVEFSVADREGVGFHSWTMDQGYLPVPHTRRFTKDGEETEGDVLQQVFIDATLSGPPTDARWGAYTSFLRARQNAGGPMDPYYAGTDWRALSKVPTSDIAIIEVEPIPGAMGYPVSAEKEWRVASGDAVKVTGAFKPDSTLVPEPRTTLWRGLDFGQVDEAEVERIAADPEAWVFERLKGDLGMHWTDVADVAWRFGGSDWEHYGAGSPWRAGIVIEGAAPERDVVVVGTPEWREMAGERGIIPPDDPDYFEHEVTLQRTDDVDISAIHLQVSNGVDYGSTTHRIDLERLAALEREASKPDDDERSLGSVPTLEPTPAWVDYDTAVEMLRNDDGRLILANRRGDLAPILAHLEGVLDPDVIGFKMGDDDGELDLFNGNTRAYVGALSLRDGYVEIRADADYTPEMHAALFSQLPLLTDQPRVMFHPDPYSKPKGIIIDTADAWASLAANEDDDFPGDPPDDLSRFAPLDEVMGRAGMSDADVSLSIYGSEGREQIEAELEEAREDRADRDRADRGAWTQIGTDDEASSLGDDARSTTLEDERLAKMGLFYGEDFRRQVQYHRTDTPLVQLWARYEAEGAGEEFFAWVSDEGYEGALDDHLAGFTHESPYGWGFRADIERLSIDENGNIEFKVHFVDEDGDSHGVSTRTMNSDGEVSHDFLEVYESARGSHLATAWNRYNDAWYLANGFPDVSVHAALSDGGYMWAGDFFEAPADTKRRAINLVEERSRRILDGDSDATPAQRISAIQALADIEEMGDLDDIEAMGGIPFWEIAHLGLHDAVREDRDWVGRVALRGISWSGTKDLAALAGFDRDDLPSAEAYEPDYSNLSAPWAAAMENRHGIERSWRQHLNEHSPYTVAADGTFPGGVVRRVGDGFHVHVTNDHIAPSNLGEFIAQTALVADVGTEYSPGYISFDPGIGDERRVEVLDAVNGAIDGNANEGPGYDWVSQEFSEEGAAFIRNARGTDYLAQTLPRTDEPWEVFTSSGAAGAFPGLILDAPLVATKGDDERWTLSTVGGDPVVAIKRTSISADKTLYDIESFTDDENMIAVIHSVIRHTSYGPSIRWSGEGVETLGNDWSIDGFPKDTSLRLHGDEAYSAWPAEWPGGLTTARGNKFGRSVGFGLGDSVGFGLGDGEFGTGRFAPTYDEGNVTWAITEAIDIGSFDVPRLARHLTGEIGATLSANDGIDANPALADAVGRWETIRLRLSDGESPVDPDEIVRTVFGTQDTNGLGSVRVADREIIFDMREFRADMERAEIVRKREHAEATEALRSQAVPEHVADQVSVRGDGSTWLFYEGDYPLSDLAEAMPAIVAQSDGSVSIEAIQNSHLVPIVRALQAVDVEVDLDLDARRLVVRRGTVGGTL